MQGRARAGRGCPPYARVRLYAVGFALFRVCLSFKVLSACLAGGLALRVHLLPLDHARNRDCKATGQRLDIVKLLPLRGI